MRRFFTSRRFLINLLLAVASSILIIWSTLAFLDYYTSHGETIAVPDISGLSAEEIQDITNQKKLRFEIVDSLYVADKPKGTALDQDPPAEALVKEYRTIYVTMNSYHPPRVSMPRLVDRSLRSVVIITENMGLKLGDYEYVPDLCTGCVLKQKYKGKEIEEGTLIPKGAEIELVIGMGISEDRIKVPLLIDLKLDSTISLLQHYLLNLGGENYDETVQTLEDSLEARVYKQAPVYSEKTYIPLGSSIDVWLTRDTSKIDTKARENFVIDTSKYSDQRNDTSQVK